MSGQAPGGAGQPAPRPTTNGVATGMMGPQQRNNDGQVGSAAGSSGQTNSMSPSNLNSIVTKSVKTSPLRKNRNANITPMTSPTPLTHSESDSSPCDSRQKLVKPLPYTKPKIAPPRLSNAPLDPEPPSRRDYASIYEDSQQLGSHRLLSLLHGVGNPTEGTQEEVFQQSKPNEKHQSLTPTALNGFGRASKSQRDLQILSKPPDGASVDPRLVIEYLSKKGYSRTEAMLRAESANQDVDGRPLSTKTEEAGGVKYGKAFDLMRRWIEENLDIYKADLRRLLWPVFVHSFLTLVSDAYARESRNFFNNFKSNFEKEHVDDLRTLEPIALPEHVLSNETAKTYRANRYRITLSQVAFNNLIRFLESKDKEGGGLIVGVIQTYLAAVTVERAADDQSVLAQQLSRARAVEDFPAEDEGIPGHNPGSANLERTAGSSVLTRLKLGAMPLENDLMTDVRAELEEEDAKNPPVGAQNSLVAQFEQRIKREESEDAPTRNELQLPPSVARDVAMEVQKVKEDRDRFKIEGRTGGVGPGVNVTMFTFHNTYDSINCLDFSEDSMLVAAGMSESYIRVWSLDGKALSSALPSSSPEQPPSASRRLIGHSGPVYAVSFSPSIASSNPYAPSTASKHLLSSSADKTVRLWSLETWTCLVVYKGHDHPVWDVTWGPFGLYFLTGSLDKTSRLWRTDHIEGLRMFVGHDKDVDCVGFHPNSAYVFTGSSDKMVRMWAVGNGYPVRLFTGHTGNVTSLACSPSGKILASADDAGTIILWDLASGRLKKRMRGHGKGGIWSLSWSVESTVLASGGADGTVRIWDVEPAKEANGTQGRIVAEGGAGQKIDGNAQMQAAVGAGGKKKGKDVMVSADQISAFPTKKSPVYKVRFTRQNLVIAGGAYLP